MVEIKPNSKRASSLDSNDLTVWDDIIPWHTDLKIRGIGQKRGLPGVHIRSLTYPAYSSRNI
jgi:hypothetical protein